MSINKYVRIYTGYLFAYMSYKAIFYTLSQICDKVDEIIVSDNSKSLPNEIKDISATHKYKTGKEIVDTIGARGGQGVITVRKSILSFAKRMAETIVINPLSKAIGFLAMKIPIVRKIYTGVKATKVAIASIGALISVRVIARFDYWALILSDSLPQVPIETKSILAGIRRLRIGQKDLSICVPQSNEVLNLVMDEDVSIRKKEKVLIDLFEFYQRLPENHIFKNRFFTCIVYMLIALSISDSIGFKLALRLLYRLLNEGKISLETYREILSQLVIGGVPVVDVEIV